jgi:hypothetical protein
MLAVIFALSGSGITYAGVLPYMPQPNQLVSAGAKGDLPYIVGMRFSSSNIFKFTFILNTGEPNAKESQLRPEIDKIGKYFLAALTIPEKDIWVNLSPYEADRITTPSLGLTDLGKDMLGEDYVLKQLSSSLTCPDSDSGKQFWDRVYSQVQGRTTLTKNDVINTFNKIWIVPNKIKITEANDRAVISEASLKVMTEADYLAMQQNGVGARSPRPGQGNPAPTNNSVTAMRDVIVPIIEQEVNTGKNFAQLRQLYRSIIMAAWYKKKLQNTVLNQVYFNKEKIKGADVNDPKIKDKIYNEYVNAFKTGVYNMVKKERVANRITSRQYFSGGIGVNGVDAAAQHATPAGPDVVDTGLAQAAPAAQRDAEGMELQLTGQDGQPLALGQATIKPFPREVTDTILGEWGMKPLHGEVQGKEPLHRGGVGEGVALRSESVMIFDNETDASIDAVLKETTRTPEIEAALKIGESVRGKVREIRARVGRGLSDKQAVRLATAEVFAVMQKDGQQVLANLVADDPTISWAKVVSILRANPDAKFSNETVNELLDKVYDIHLIGIAFGLGNYTKEHIKAKLKGGTDLGLTPAAAYACCRAEAWGSEPSKPGQFDEEKMIRGLTERIYKDRLQYGRGTEENAMKQEIATTAGILPYAALEALIGQYEEDEASLTAAVNAPKAEQSELGAHFAAMVSHGPSVLTPDEIKIQVVRDVLDILRRVKISSVQELTDRIYRDRLKYGIGTRENDLIQETTTRAKAMLSDQLAALISQYQDEAAQLTTAITAQRSAVPAFAAMVSVDHPVLFPDEIKKQVVQDVLRILIREQGNRPLVADAEGSNIGGLDFTNAQNISIEAANGGVKLSGKEAVDYLVSGQVTGARLVNTGLSL